MDGGERVSSSFRSLAMAIASNLAAIFRSRLELMSAELAEERHRLVQMLIWATAAIFCGVMAFILINITVVYLFWEDARLAVLITLTLFYTCMLAGIGIGFRRYLRQQRPPFAETIEEFQKDYECFRKRS
jgi:uncharacterized membrane protein YqjE